ncbi:hypothetical protein F4X33_03155 [Candidatus Poribacteria bacterium]|nr:hypothetical protein [Candidatus Poribacteria bacterium]
MNVKRELPYLSRFTFHASRTMTAREVIEEAQLLIGDPNVDFHDRDRMLFALNRATNRISTRSRSIHEQWHHPVIAGQYQYALPPGSLYIRKAKYKNGTWCDLDRGFFDDVEARAAYPGGGPPRTFSLWQNARVEKFVGTVEEVENDGSREEHLKRQVVIPFLATETGVLLGDLIFNLSVGHAEGIVTGLGSVDISDFPDPVYKLAYSALAGGTRDRFEVGDQVRITSPHTSGHAMIIAPAPTRNDEAGEESIAVFVARRHRVITPTDINNDNDSLELDDEFNDTLIYEMLHWARVQRMGLDTTAQLYRRLSNEEYLTAIPLVENRISQSLNSWESRFNGAGSSRRDVDVKDTTQNGFTTTTIA